MGRERGESWGAGRAKDERVRERLLEMKGEREGGERFLALLREGDEGRGRERGRVQGVRRERGVSHRLDQKGGERRAPVPPPIGRSRT